MKAKRFMAFCLAYTMLLRISLELPQHSESLSVMTASAVDAVEGTYQEVFSYEVYDDYVVITKYSGSDTEVKIPAVIDGLPVTQIGESAFSGCKEIERVELPSGLKKISSMAFYNCKNLISVNLPDTLTSLSTDAFWGSYLLSSIIVAEENPCFRSVDGVLFNADGSSLLIYPCGKQDTTYIVPGGTVKIGMDAFRSSQYLETVILPESLITISNYAFEYAKRLNNVEYSSDFLEKGRIWKSSFLATPYQDALTADEDGFVVSKEGILFSAPSAETLMIPASVKFVPGFVFNSSDLMSVSFEGNCHLSTEAFEDCSNLETVTVKGNCILEKNAFYPYGCKNLKTLSVGGNLQVKGQLPNTLQVLDYSRTPLKYVFSEHEDKETVNVAQSSVSYGDNIPATTCSNSTSFNNGFSVDTVQEVCDSSGNIYAVCGDKDAVSLIPHAPNIDTVVIQKEGFTFGAAAMDENNNLYIMWGYDISDSVIDEEMESENIVFSKYDIHGNLIAEYGLTVQQSGAQYPLAMGNANMLVKDNVLGCFFNTRWTLAADGLHHQGSEFIAINKDTMKLIDLSTWEGSHSFGVSMIPVDYGFAAIQMGDGGARGINFNSYYVNGTDFSSDYLNYNGSHVLYHSSGQYGTNAHQLDGNTTYIHMGGLAKSNTTYAVAGKSERVYTTDIFYDSDLHTGVYDVFVKLTDQSLMDNMEDLAGEVRIDEATGEIADRNVIWLTECNETEKAGQVKIVTLEDGSYCVLWEKFVNDVFDSVRYVILDECGNILRSETEIQNARLSDTSVQPVVQGSTLTWAVGNKAIGGITWYTVDLELFENYSERFTEMDRMKDFAEEHGLVYSPKQGAYGMCGNEVYWAYLEDSCSLLIVGTGAMQYTGTAPWSAFSDHITDILIDEGVTSTQSSAFEECTSLTKVELPETLTVIGKGLFQDCSSLEEIVLPDSVTKIENYAFSYCTSLTKIELPDSMTEIGDHAFFNCAELKSIYIPSATEKIGSGAFYDCINLETVVLFNPEIEIKDSSLGEYFPYGMNNEFADLTLYGFAGSTAQTYAEENELNFVRIDGACGKNAAWQFDQETETLHIYGNGKMDDFTKGRQPWAEFLSEITSVTFDEAITSIGANAFCGAESLTSIILEDHITAIGSNAFDQSCRIYAPADSAGQAYAEKNELSFVRIDGTCGKQTAWYYDEDTQTLSVVGEGAMEDYSDRSDVPWDSFRRKITSVSIAEGITFVGAYSFYDCAVLKTVRLPDTIQQINQSAFCGCDVLRSIQIPESVVRIEDSAFRGCPVLKAVYLLNPETEIAEQAIGYSYSDSSYSGITLYGYADSTAQTYAESNKFTFIDLIETEPETTTTTAETTTTTTSTTTTTNTSKTTVSTMTTIADTPESTASTTTTIADTLESTVTTTTTIADASESTVSTTTTIADAPESTASATTTTDTSEINPDLPDVKLGDVNGDGEINLKDAVLIRRYIAGGWNIDTVEYADVNGDGEINLKDVVLIRRYIAGGWE